MTYFRLCAALFKIFNCEPTHCPHSSHKSTQHNHTKYACLCKGGPLVYVRARVSLRASLCKGRPVADNRRLCLILEEFGGNRRPANPGSPCVRLDTRSAALLNTAIVKMAAWRTDILNLIFFCSICFTHRCI